MGGCLSCKHLTGSVRVQACLLEWVHALVCVCCLLTKPICMQMYECRMLWQHTFLTMGELWCCTCISRSSKITTENRGIFPPSLSQLHHEKRKFIRRRNKHRSRQNSPPQLVSNFIKLLDVFLAENSHVVRALPPSSPDHRHVLRNVHPLRASSQRHHPYQQPPVWAGLQATVLLMLELPTRVKRSRKKKTFRPRRRNLTAADEEEEEEEGCGGERESEREREREREGCASSQQKETKLTEQWTCTSRATSRLLELICPPSPGYLYHFPGQPFEMSGFNSCQFVCFLRW